MTDIQVIALISFAHFVSHFLQLSLPPLFPVLKDALGVPYVALGFLVTLFYAASGTGQTISGFLVDRFGARRLLLIGLVMIGGAITLAGLVTSYWMIVPVVLVAGAGNSVFHPADYSILNAAVGKHRLGRGYSIHGLSGTLGFATSPAVIGMLSHAIGWRGALVAAGATGPVAAMLLAGWTRRLVDHRSRNAATGAREHDRGAIHLLLAAPVIAAFIYFALLAMAYIGTQTFSVTALVALYDVPLAVATATLTGFLLGNAAGILAGGVLADRTRRHDVVAAIGVTVSAALILVVASGTPTIGVTVGVMAAAGVALGVSQPSRDLLVRAVTPVHASGKVFGFVYSGLDLGSTLTPLLFGWLLDRGEPRAVFVVVAVLMFLTIVTIVEVRRRTLVAAGT